MSEASGLTKFTVRLPQEAITTVKRAALDEGRTAQEVVLDAIRDYSTRPIGVRRAARASAPTGLTRYTSVEVCAGAGGQALGLERAGFVHVACVELDQQACATLRQNRPDWEVIEADLKAWQPPSHLRNVDLLAGGVPCPPFSIAGQQLGADDERDLFPEMIRLADELQPRAIMIENVRGLLARKFDAYREHIVQRFTALGYQSCGWELLNSADFGVPQARRRTVLVLMRDEAVDHFSWPKPSKHKVTVASALKPHLRHWQGYEEWAHGAAATGPALVGGSKKHGGADLGPTRARAAWRGLGVDGIGLADEPPAPDHTGPIRLTVPMAAAIQGFPRDWRFSGRKTAAYRQVGNAFPPPVAHAVGSRIFTALSAADLRAPSTGTDPLLTCC